MPWEEIQNSHILPCSSPKTNTITYNDFVLHSSTSGISMILLTDLLVHEIKFYLTSIYYTVCKQKIECFVVRSVNLMDLNWSQ